MKLPIPLLAVFVSLPGVAADSATPSNAANAALLEQGKKIFVARCAKCHDNDATRKLPDGTTLLGRLAKTQDPEARLGTRLKDPQARGDDLRRHSAKESATFESMTAAQARLLKGNLNSRKIPVMLIEEVYRSPDSQAVEPS